MFSQEPRRQYYRNPLAEVICQLRFPEILTIQSELPAKFQEAIRASFPHYSVRKENPAPKLSGTPGNMTLQPQPQSNNYQFVSADGAWRVNLTSRFISLSCSRYTCWEDFALQLDKPLAAFIQIYKPAMFTRVGLRYVNFISRKALDLEGTPFRELISSRYLGILDDDEVNEINTTRCSVDAELNLRGGCKCKLHAGPGIIKKNGQPDPEVKFIFDQDLYMEGNIPVNVSAGALETIHSHAFPIFRDAITDTLHIALSAERK